MKYVTHAHEYVRLLERITELNGLFDAIGRAFAVVAEEVETALPRDDRTIFVNRPVDGVLRIDWLSNGPTRTIEVPLAVLDNEAHAWRAWLTMEPRVRVRPLGTDGSPR